MRTCLRSRFSAVVASGSVALLGCSPTAASRDDDPMQTPGAGGNAPEQPGAGGSASGGSGPGGGGPGGNGTGGEGTAGQVANGGTGGDYVPSGGGSDPFATGGQGGFVGTGGDPSAGGNPNLGMFDAGTDPNRNQVVAGQVCERLATVQCAGEAACCVTATRSFDECKTIAKRVCAEELFLDAISLSSLTGYDMAHAEVAFTEFEQKAAACDPSVASWAASPDGLRGIAKGTRASGDDCTPPLTSLSGPEAAPYLASCSNPETTACLPRALPLSWRCTARGGDGADCFTDINCVDGFYCDNPNFALGGGTCRARKTDGSPCTAPNQCASLLCRGGICAPADQQGAYCLG